MQLPINIQDLIHHQQYRLTEKGRTVLSAHGFVDTNNKK